MAFTFMTHNVFRAHVMVRKWEAGYSQKMQRQKARAARVVIQNIHIMLWLSLLPCCKSPPI